MESNYRNSDFEHFLKDNADEYRMFPSEKVWKGIHNTLHTRRKWYGLGLAFLLLLTGGAVTWVMTAYPVARKENTPPPETKLLAIQGEKVPTAAAERDITEIISFSNTTTPVPAPAIVAKKTASTTAEIINLPAENDVDGKPAAENKYISYTTVADRQRTATPAKTGKVAGSATDDPASEISAIPTTTGSPLDQPLAISFSGRAAENNTSPRYPVNIGIENETARYKAPKKRVSWQLFVTPTISYRRLTENKSYNVPTPVDPGASPNFPFTLPHNVNSAVTHKPDMGLQIGFSGRYPLSKRIKARGGFQFNINRYDIKAFRYNGELATINLNGNGASDGVVSTWTYYRSQSGYNSNWLKNYYLSISAPIGLEVKVAGSDKTNFGVAGTIQPTFIIQDRAYLLSSDYKNYAEVPWLIRRANVSTGFEAFVNYTSKGGTKWQVGPQVRYQLLSSFRNTYPVKENLFDVGLKIGVSLNE